VKSLPLALGLTLAITAACGGPAPQQSAAPGSIDRTVLPIPEPNVVPITEVDARNAKAPARFQVTAPQKAPFSGTCGRGAA